MVTSATSLLASTAARPPNRLAGAARPYPVDILLTFTPACLPVHPVLSTYTDLRDKQNRIKLAIPAIPAPAGIRPRPVQT